MFTIEILGRTQIVSWEAKSFKRGVRLNVKIDDETIGMIYITYPVSDFNAFARRMVLAYYGLCKE